MSTLLAARAQMALSLAFHIVFASAGIAMPLLMVLAELRWLRTRDPEWLTLTRAWARGTAVLFAVGAVSGTVLSFELGLLFPVFMKHAGPLVGLPFSLEGMAFFAEGIFLGVYMYGWERVSPRVHLLAGVVVALAGLASAAFVLIANAWMNAPVGFRLAADGTLADIDPVAAMGTPFALHEILHMALAAYAATGLAAAAIHAWVLRRRPGATLHEKALGLALLLAVPTSLAQPLVGHHAAQVVARHQPLKLAAMEQLEHTQAHAPLKIGPLRIPSGLSILAFDRPGAVVTGLDAFPRADWPSQVVRVAWQAMVFIGFALAALSVWAAYRRLKHRAAWLTDRRFLTTLVCAGPLGFVAVEAGWIVTEVGRQPWVIYGVLRTADSVTPVRGLVASLVAYTLVYLGLAVALVAVLRHQFRSVKS